MKIKIRTLLCIAPLLVCCQHKEIKSTSQPEIQSSGNSKLDEFKKSNYFDEDRIKKDKYEVKFNGDWKAFSELGLYYSYNKSRIEEILPYALLIVEKHKNYKYSSDVVHSLIELYTGKIFQYDGTNVSLISYLKNLEDLNESQRAFALYFLNLGADNKDITCLKELELVYRHGIGIEKNLTKADSLQQVLKRLK